MTKLITLTVFSCLIATLSFAQSTNPAPSKGSLHLSLGGALPIGAFGSKNVNDPKAGDANIGPLAEIGYSHPLKDARWGLSINIRGRLNRVDDAAMQQFKAGFPTYSWSASKTNYRTIAAMAGVYHEMELPESPKLRIHVELSLGAAQCTIPDYTALGVVDSAGLATGFIQAKASKVNTITFSAAAKFGLVYHINKNLQFLANVDFWYAQPKFQHLTNTMYVVPQLIIPGVISLSNSALPIQVFQATAPYKQPMNTLNLTAGVGLTL